MVTNISTINSKANIASGQYISLADFKSETIIDLTDYNDPKLQEFIDRATSLIDTWLGGSIAYGFHTDRVRCMYDYPKNGLAAQLPRRPILSINSIGAEYEPHSEISWDTLAKVSNWRVNSSIGYIEYFGLGLANYSLSVCVRDPLASNVSPMVTVSYYSGYITIPADVKLATKILIEQLIRNDEGEDVEITSVAIGNYREGYKKNVGVKGMGIIGGGDQVERLLRPYRQPGQTMFINGPY